ncbi:beta-adaptin-like protein [Acrasis kona]|uniref:Beta-adaptin-like protein n=1 Tax=Acrasis kona TaxID=1008807 RepID=A0AAW2YWE9_9EUKA
MSTPAKGAPGFFSSQNKRSEINEWRLMLSNEKEGVRKDAVKKVIAAMTVGKDVQMLFSDVVKCVQTNNIELKKLVYLYIMNYAKTQPDLAILAVNTFEKDATHPNPLIRGLAVRTMGCIRVGKIVEYLADPLRRAIKDKDPYVRKTSAVAIAKLFDIDKQMAIEQGFIESLHELLTDPNPMVVANAVKALSEIAENSEQVTLDFTPDIIRTLGAALNECTEWGQVFILDALSTYNPRDEKEALEISDRVVPRLQHANSAVVLSSVKVILRMMRWVGNADEVKNLSKKMSAPLVTLLSSEPEIQYVALRNIDLIVQRRPGILAKDIKMFFCKYNDPIYVKLEKLEIMIKLASERNIDTVLLEFKEYATEVDVEFVRRSVRAIGRCAIKLERAAQKCIDVLLDLILTKVNYVVQEAIIVIKDIFRRYPNRYEKIIGTLCANLETLDEPEAKASMIWIIGEYAGNIENADELLEIFVETFHDETPQVQLQLLTATMKLFLRRPEVTQDLVKQVLKLCTDESENPDLRDRGYVYWRLLLSDPAAAKNIVLAEKPVISDDTSTLPKNILDDLINHIATLSSVYHKSPELFVSDYKKKSSTLPNRSPSPPPSQSNQDVFGTSQQQLPPPTTTTNKSTDLLGGLDELLGGITTTAPIPTSRQSHPSDDPFGLDSMMMPDSNYQQSSSSPMVKSIPKNLLLSAQKGQGLEIYGAVVNQQGSIKYSLSLSNQSQQTLTGFAVKFNQNCWGLAPTGPLNCPALYPGQTENVMLPLGRQSQANTTKKNNILQVAIKTPQFPQPVYFQDKFNMTVLFENHGKLGEQDFLNAWGSLPDELATELVPTQPGWNKEDVRGVLAGHNVFYVANHSDQTAVNYYYSAKFVFDGQEYVVVMELMFPNGSNRFNLSVKIADMTFAAVISENISSLLLQ